MVHTETVEPGTLALLKELMSLEILKPYCLVGGTSLALQIGHRKSIDLDLFGKVALDYRELLKALSSLGTVKELQAFDNVLQFEINDIKVDIVNYQYNMLKPIFKIDDLRLASLEDIAAMKIFAAECRGSKKDLFDIYCLLEKFDINEIIDFALEKYPKTNKLHASRSLIFFDDAEETPDPDMLIPVSWDQVKERLITEVRRIVL